MVKSRDISYAFTNLIANDYYSIKSYDNFCLFCRIDSSTKKEDKIAFFVYFTFKGESHYGHSLLWPMLMPDWKRVLLADGPRQSINALTLYSFAVANGWDWSNLPAWWDHSAIIAMLLFAICATVGLFVLSFALIVIASILYMPLLCYIQGNLKEYVCHKVDKRIAELVQRNRRDRIRRNAALEKKLAQGSIKDAPGVIPQPTLPNVSLDDDDYKVTKEAMRPRQPVVRSKSKDTLGDYGSFAPGYPPSMASAPASDVYPAYPPSIERSYSSTSRVNEPYQLDYSDYSSTTNLTAHAAAPGLSYPPTAYNYAPPQYPPRSRSNSSLQSYDTRSDSQHGQRYEPPSNLAYDNLYGYR